MTSTILVKTQYKTQTFAESLMEMSSILSNAILLSHHLIGERQRWEQAVMSSLPPMEIHRMRLSCGRLINTKIANW
jgi:hypothetical protein